MNRATRPNILFFFPDQHRFDWVGLNPRIPVRTPNLDRLAERGVYFANAICPSPLCGPSRAALASGKEYDRCGVPTNKENYPFDRITFYKLLRESGYHVAGCGKFDLHKGAYIWGLDGKNCLKEWGFSDGIDNAGKWDAIHSGSDEPKDPYMAFLERKGLRETHIRDFQKRKDKSVTDPTSLPEEAYCDNYVARNGLELMSRFPKGKPWFLQVNFTGPHDPWDVTERMKELYRGVEFPQPNDCRRFSPEIHNAIRRNYSAMIENIDRWLGVYIDEIDRRGELENTLIVYSSDHGEMLGDHNLWGKSVPYQPSVGVPLVIAGCGVRSGYVHEDPVTIIDLAATFLDYAGIDRPDDMDSISMRPLLEGETNHHRDFVLSGLRSWRLVFDGRFKLIKGFTPREKRTDEPLMLFDLKNDPQENNNIADEAEAVAARLSTLLPRVELQKP